MRDRAGGKDRQGAHCTLRSLRHYNVGMDATLASVAKELGTTPHRVTRAIDRLGIRLVGPAEQRRGRPAKVLRERDVERLRDELGVAPPSKELTREDLFVLASLDRVARGFTSIRALAHSAGISPTGAAAAVRRLEAKGLISRQPGLTRMSGRVVDATLITIDREGVAWQRTKPLVSDTRPPVPAPTPAPKVVPRRFWHLFWNANPATLRVADHPDYIAARLLLSGDPQAEEWATSHLPASAIARTSTLRGLGDVERTRLQTLARSVTHA